MSTLAQTLNAKLKNEPLTEPVMPESPQEQASRAEDNSPIISRLGADNSRFANVISRFVDRLGGQLQAMDVAYSDRDMEALAKLAHWLKGAGGTVGFDVFNEPAAELELAAKATDLAAIERQFRQIHGLAARIAIDDKLATAGQIAAPTSFKAVG
jgi:HPt (histidine-containing phosphotransfer) domain-containing protein